MSKHLPISLTRYNLAIFSRDAEGATRHLEEVISDGVSSRQLVHFLGRGLVRIADILRLEYYGVLQQGDPVVETIFDDDSWPYMGSDIDDLSDSMILNLASAAPKWDLPLITAAISRVMQTRANLCAWLSDPALELRALTVSLLSDCAPLNLRPMWSTIVLRTPDEKDLSFRDQ